MASPRIRTVANQPVEPKLYRGVINTKAAHADDLITAVIPALFDGEEFVAGPLTFDPHRSGVLPGNGDACLIAIDDQGGEWLLRYETASGVEHVTEP